MAKVVIAGGTGFIGKAVARQLKRDDFEPVTLGRGLSADVVWDAATLGDWTKALEGAEGVINLTGSPITEPWTTENRKKILESRIGSTNVLAEAIRRANRPPAVWINASAIGFYGDRGDELLTETSSAGSGFLSEVCQAWETALFDGESPAVRAAVRIGIVLGRDGGALGPLVPLTRAFLGGAQGDGSQWMSWILDSDLAWAFSHIVRRRESGVWNGVGPQPVRNRDFMHALRSQLGRPWSPPAPKFALEVAAKLGGPDPSVLLSSMRVVPQRLLDAGALFTGRDLKQTLANLAL
jgi:uncharacterized protein (TIGR01777 family)